MKVQELGAGGVCGTSALPQLGEEEGLNPALGGLAVVGRESQVGGELGCWLLPLVPVGEAGDPQPAAAPGALPAPCFSHAYTTAIHFMQQNKPC